MTMAIRMKKGDLETTPGFVAAMAGATTQVTVVSTDGPAGKFGVTVSAFASVSAEPPLVLVCINRKSPAIAGIETNGCFCVNLLRQDQCAIADCFAGRPGPQAPYNFECANWDIAATGAPVLSEASANFDCQVETTYDAGTHRIFIGRVMQAHASAHPSLAFSRRAYQALSPLDRNAS